MNLLQTFRPVVKSQQKQWLTTRFASNDDDFSLRVSVYLDSRTERAELLSNLAELVRAYGFTTFSRLEQAPWGFPTSGSG